MKSLRLLFVSFVCFVVPLLSSVVLTSCAAPSARVQEVKTLKIVGTSVDDTMKLAAQLYHDGRISADVWQRIATVHDQQFQPAFNLAVQAVRSDLSSVASPDLIALAGQLTAILAPYLESKH